MSTIQQTAIRQTASQQTTLQQTGGSLTMAVQLILASGSRSGLAAPLLEGYFLIGRHEECQIRPKSRSVSRRHCLLHNQNGLLRVFDLGSTSGTHVDGQRIPAHHWRTLDHGMQIRCGKICFNVVLTPQQDSGQESVDSLLSGSAFDADDIADFLSSADDEDREARYASIRGKVGATDSSDSAETTPFDTAADFVTEVGGDSESESSPRSTEPESAMADTAKKRTATAVKIPQTKKKRVATSRSFSLPAFDFRNGTGTLLVATLVALVVLAFFGRQLYHVVQGPEVRVVRGLD